jgi:hypothetical protein
MRQSWLGFGFNKQTLLQTAVPPEVRRPPGKQTVQ